MKNLKQLMFTGTRGYVVDDSSECLVTPDNVARLRDIPIFFIHGGQNQVYSPESTMRSYDILRERFGSSQYERWVFEGRGHLDCWMGVSCNMDVYPRVEEHIKKTISRLVDRD